MAMDCTSYIYNIWSFSGHWGICFVCIYYFSTLSLLRGSLETFDNMMPNHIWETCSCKATAVSLTCVFMHVHRAVVLWLTISLVHCAFSYQQMPIIVPLNIQNMRLINRPERDMQCLSLAIFRYMWCMRYEVLMVDHQVDFIIIYMFIIGFPRFLSSLPSLHRVYLSVYTSLRSTVHAVSLGWETFVLFAFDKAQLCALYD